MEMLAITPQRQHAADYIAKQPFTMLFNGQETPPNCPFPWGDPGTHSALGPCKFTCQTPSRSSQLSFRRRWFAFPILYHGMAPSPLLNCTFPWGDLDPHLIHGYVGLPKPTHQTTSRSVQPFLRDTSTFRTCTDTHTTPHVSSNRPYLYAMHT